MKLLFLLSLYIGSCIPIGNVQHAPKCTVADVICVDDVIVVCTSNYEWVEIQDCSKMGPWHCSMMINFGTYACVPTTDASIIE